MANIYSFIFQWKLRMIADAADRYLVQKMITFTPFYGNRNVVHFLEANMNISLK